MNVFSNYISPIDYLESHDNLSADKALGKFIGRLPVEPEMMAIRAKQDKAAAKFGKAMRAGKDSKDLWVRMEWVYVSEIRSITYACFLCGVAYGLSPITNTPIQDMIDAAVRPVEAATWSRWQEMEVEIHKLSRDLQRLYAKFDRTTSRYKGYEQGHAFAQGVRQGRAFSQKIIEAI